MVVIIEKCKWYERIFAPFTYLTTCLLPDSMNNGSNSRLIRDMSLEYIKYGGITVQTKFYIDLLEKEYQNKKNSRNKNFVKTVKKRKNKFKRSLR